MISNNNENSYSKTYKKTVQKLKNFNFQFLPTLSQNYRLTNLKHRGERKQFSGQHKNFKIFRGLNFFKNFPKSRSKFRNFITIFMKKLKLLTRFHSGQSFAILWCLNWFLQNLANAFSSVEKICWKRIIKNFSTILKKNFFDWFLSKVNHNRTPLFFGVSHGEHVSKVIHFGEKVQNHKKICQKSWLFRKIWILWRQLLRIFGGLYMRLPYVLLWLLGEKVQDV